ncbi:hypothetical protein scyTo_0006426, partial [Scyliorhinus torazame]|nr:hypothetical protein [Scyliorhinus torazame]
NFQRTHADHTYVGYFPGSGGELNRSSCWEGSQHGLHELKYVSLCCVEILAFVSLSNPE